MVTKKTKRPLTSRAEAHKPMWARAMNAEQLEAILHTDGPLRLLAAAGSGKTRVVVHRILRLVTDGGVRPNRVLAVTFSTKAADEMNERLKRLGCKGARVGTWHSLCLEILKTDHRPQGSWTVEGSVKGANPKIVLKNVLGYREMDWKGADFNLVAGYIGKCKANLFDDDSAEALALANLTFGRDATRAVEAFARYNMALADKQLLTFDDFLVFAARHLQEDEQARLAWAGRYDYVIQDEGQDANKAQNVIAGLLARDHRNYMIVGDVFQCHPAGTMIEIEKGREVPIEDLSNESRVRGWNRNAQKMVAGRRVEVSARPYFGPIYDMTAAERMVPMTPNHRVLARWTDRGSEDCVTYLMWRSDLGFRVGWCKLFATTGKGGSVRVFHFAHRCRIERAEKAWILGVHASRTEASVEESIIAAKYGIPTSTFEPVCGAQHLTEKSIAAIFDAVRGDNEERGMRVLAEFDREFSFPMYPWPGRTREDVSKIGRMTYFECYASNLLAGHMSVPLPDATNAWTPVSSVFVRPYEGKVYSLDVEEDHSYAANGVVVLNSIYAFRGSKPDFLAQFEDEWPGAKTIWLGTNYRSGRKVIDAANGIVRPARVPGYEPRDMVAGRDLDGEVTVRASEDLDGEAASFVAWAQNLVVNGDAGYGEICALYRTNAQSRALEEKLLGARIPYVVVGGTSFYERAEVRSLLAYLRVAAERGDVEDVKRCINAPFRYLGAAFVDRVMHAVEGKKDVDWTTVVGTVAMQAGLQSRQRGSASEWCEMIEGIATRVKAGLLDDATDEQKRLAQPSVILEDVIRATRFIEWLTKEEGEDTIESSAAANVREMMRVAGRFSTTIELLSYIDETIRSARKQREDGQAGGDRVLLMTVHKAKGLEWPHVWVAGMNEMLLPHARGDEEEERRVAYVAATRARDSLVLSYVRTLATRAGVKDAHPSRFILDTGLPIDVPTEYHEDADVDLGEPVFGLVDGEITSDDAPDANPG